MKQVKIIFFDLANTLVFQPAFYKSVQDILRKSGYSFTEEEIRKTHKLLTEEIIFPDKTTREFYLEFNTTFLSTLGIIEPGNLALEIYNGNSNHPWCPFPDTSILPTIPIQKGIISNWDLSLREKLKTFFEINFNPIIGSAESGFRKPDLSIFQFAINQAGFEPSEILWVGDSIRLDMEPAKQLGIESVLIDRDNIFTNFKGKSIRSLTELNLLI